MNLESLKQAGAGLLEQASATYNRFARVEEVTSTKDHDSQPGTFVCAGRQVPAMHDPDLRHRVHSHT
jgi:hypothetical protein